MLMPGDLVPFGCRNNIGTATRFYAPRAVLNSSTQHGYGWGDWHYLGGGWYNTGQITTKLNWLNSRLAESPFGSNTLSILPFEPVMSLFLFAANVGGTATHPWLGTIHSAAISQGSEIVHNFVPCIDNLGNPCMYDTITKEAFCNDGSGQFIVPAETTTYSLRQPQAAYAQLTKHGICRLYHVPEGYEGSEEDYAQEFGFKQLVENDRPEEIEEGYYWHPRWKETETEVILYWTKEIEEEMTDV